MGFFSECVVGHVSVCVVYLRGFVHLVKLGFLGWYWVILGGLGDLD